MVGQLAVCRLQEPPALSNALIQIVINVRGLRQGSWGESELADMRLASRKKLFTMSRVAERTPGIPLCRVSRGRRCVWFLVRSILTPPTCPGTVDGSSRGNLHKPASLASTVAVSAATWLLSSWRRRMIGTLE